MNKLKLPKDSRDLMKYLEGTPIYTLDGETLYDMGPGRPYQVRCRYIEDVKKFPRTKRGLQQAREYIVKQEELGYRQRCESYSWSMHAFNNPTPLGIKHPEMQETCLWMACWDALRIGLL